MKRKIIALVFLCVFGPFAHAGGYIYSVNSDVKTADLSQNQLDLNVILRDGPGGYSYNIFYSNCTTEVVPYTAHYLIVPTHINIGGVPVALTWSESSVLDLTDSSGNIWKVIASFAYVNNNSCQHQGKSGYWNPGVSNVVTATAKGNLQNVPPGSYSVSLGYYVGSVNNQYESGRLPMIRDYGMKGAMSYTPPTTFTGAAACSNSSVQNTTIDFGTITSNGSIQAGPSKTLGLVCNYNVKPNDVSYSLTSNNPVSGKPSTGHIVTVGLSNGAEVTLSGGAITNSDAQHVNTVISPTIDTTKSNAGVGTGSAMLKFTYN
ncbi:TPA: hypothetical protein ACX37D_003019 [Serratia marcescens]